jgi:dehydrogenase/reductase SDR family member 4
MQGLAVQECVFVLQLALDSFGRIDILVSNAAVNPAFGPILSTPEAAIDKILDINIKSPILLAKEVVPHLPKASQPCMMLCATCFSCKPSHWGHYQFSCST